MILLKQRDGPGILRLSGVKLFAGRFDCRPSLCHHELHQHPVERRTPRTIALAIWMGGSGSKRVLQAQQIYLPNASVMSKRAPHP
jgi:hypothetical protein